MPDRRGEVSPEQRATCMKGKIFVAMEVDDDMVMMIQEDGYDSNDDDHNHS